MTFPPSAVETAARNVADLLAHALEHGPAHRALVVFDRRSELNAVLTEAYRRALPEGVKPVFVVPSGNFGNLTAGLLAVQLGLPVDHFVAATNANDVLPRFFGCQP